MAYRTVIESKSVQTLIDAEAVKNPGLRDLFDGLIWRLARDPEVGYPVSGTFLRVVRSHGWAKFHGSLILAYSFTDNEVTIHDVRIDDNAAVRIAPAKSA